MKTTEVVFVIVLGVILTMRIYEDFILQSKIDKQNVWYNETNNNITTLTNSIMPSCLKGERTRK